MRDVAVICGRTTEEVDEGLLSTRQVERIAEFNDIKVPHGKRRLPYDESVDRTLVDLYLWLMKHREGKEPVVF